MKEVSATVTTTEQDLHVKRSLQIAFLNSGTVKGGGNELVEQI